MERRPTSAADAARGRAALHLDKTNFHVVRDLRIEYLHPVTGPCTMRIDIWVEKLGNTSCAYGFLCSSEDVVVAFARGQRTIVKIDPATHRPAPWTDFFREHHSTLVKDLPAYA